MPTGVQRDRQKLCHLVQMAREEWQLANNYFSWVTEPELVDYAIYWAMAAQCRYSYLLQTAKEMGITLTQQELIYYALVKVDIDSHLSN